MAYLVCLLIHKLLFKTEYIFYGIHDADSHVGGGKNNNLHDKEHITQRHFYLTSSLSYSLPMFLSYFASLCNHIQDISYYLIWVEVSLHKFLFSFQSKVDQFPKYLIQTFNCNPIHSIYNFILNDVTKLTFFQCTPFRQILTLPLSFSRLA